MTTYPITTHNIQLAYVVQQFPSCTSHMPSHYLFFLLITLQAYKEASPTGKKGKQANLTPAEDEESLEQAEETYGTQLGKIKPF